MSWQQQASTRRALDELADGLRLSVAAQQRARSLAGLEPRRTGFWQALDRLLLILGTALLLAGVAALAAWNWVELGHLGRLFLLQLAVLVAGGLAWFYRLDSLAGQAAVMAAAVLIGVLLAAVGQTYQTGADPYWLFLLWAVLLLPMALVARQAGLWLLVLLLANLTLTLLWVQVLRPSGDFWADQRLFGPLPWLLWLARDAWLAFALVVLNTLVLVVWEWLGSQLSWLRARWPLRLIGLGLVWPTVVPVLAWIVEPQRHQGVTPLALLFLLTGGCLWFYRLRRRLDLFMLTLALMSLIAVLVVAAGRWLVSDNLDGFLTLALILVTLVGAASFWLRRLARAEALIHD